MSKLTENLGNLEKQMDGKINFLEAHYIRYMEAGGDHSMYVVGNDIDDDKELCKTLKETYQKYKELRREDDE